MDNTAFQPLFIRTCTLFTVAYVRTLAHHIPLGLPLGQAQDSDVTNLVAISQVQLSQTWSRWAVNQMPDSKIRNPTNETTKYIHTYVRTHASTKYNGCTTNEACKGGPTYVCVHVRICTASSTLSVVSVRGACGQGKHTCTYVCSIPPKTECDTHSVLSQNPSAV